MELSTKSEYDISYPTNSHILISRNTRKDEIILIKHADVKYWYAFESRALLPFSAPFIIYKCAGY